MKLPSMLNSGLSWISFASSCSFLWCLSSSVRVVDAQAQGRPPLQLLFGTENGFDVGGKEDLCYFSLLPPDTINSDLDGPTLPSISAVNENLVRRALDPAQAVSDSSLYTPQLLGSCDELLDLFLEPTEELPEDRTVLAGTPIRFHAGGYADFKALFNRLAGEIAATHSSLFASLPLPASNEGSPSISSLSFKMTAWAHVLLCNARFVGDCNPFAYLRDTVDEERNEDPIPLSDKYEEPVVQVDATQWNERYIATDYLEGTAELHEDINMGTVDNYFDLVLPKNAEGVYSLKCK
jgi:hypothetical protein